MKFRYLFAAAAGFALTAPALAVEDGAQADGDAKEKKICRSEKVTGSRARVNRICLTEAQWRDLAAQTKKSIDDYSRNQTSVREGAGQAQ